MKVAPVKVAELLEEPFNPTPEQDLQRALLERMWRDAKGVTLSAGYNKEDMEKERKRNVRNALEWFQAKSNHPFGFYGVCDSLKYNPEIFLKHLFPGNTKRT